MLEFPGLGLDIVAWIVSTRGRLLGQLSAFRAKVSQRCAMLVTMIMMNDDSNDTRTTNKIMTTIQTMTVLTTAMMITRPMTTMVIMSSP